MPKLIYRILAFAFIQFFAFHLEAQEENMILPKAKKLYDYEQIFSTFHWNFFIRPSMVLTAPYHFSGQGLDFKYEAVSPEVMYGWMGQFNFKKWWGIQIGASIEEGWLRLNYYNPISFNGIATHGGHPITFENNFLVLSFPLYAVYRLPIYDKRNCWLLDFKAGAELRYRPSTATEYYDIYTNLNLTPIYTYFYFGIYGKTSIDPVFHASVGAQYILPNKKLLEFSIVGGYEPFYTQSAIYSFDQGSPREVDGSFSAKYGYLGFELNYIFTRVSHMRPERPGYTVEPVKKRLKKNILNRNQQDIRKR